jgi:soluble cytochrome b562
MKEILYHLRMSLESKIMTSVSSMMSFIKSKTKTDLVEASRKGIINIDIAMLEKTCNVVESSIESAYSRAMNEVLSTIKEIERTSNK